MLALSVPWWDNCLPAFFNNDSFSQPGIDGYYGRISYFRDWIDNQMINPVFCGGTADADATGRGKFRKNKHSQKNYV